MNPETPQNTPEQPNEQPVAAQNAYDTPQPTAPAAQPQETLAPAAQPFSAPTDVASTPATVPGKGLGIASFVVSLLGFGLIGLIMGIIAKSQSKKAGFGNGFAIAGIVIGILNIIAVIGFAALVIASGNALKDNTDCTSTTAADGTVSQNCTVGTPSSTPMTE